MTGSVVHFHPNAHFWVGFGLANLSDRTVIVTQVRAVEPPHSFVHQTGTALLHWQVPPPCPANSCLPQVEGFTPQPVTAPGPPRPLEVKPGNGEWRLGVQLDFVTGTCAELTSPTAKSPFRLLVTFHVPNGLTERETCHSASTGSTGNGARDLDLPATEIVHPHAVRSAEAVFRNDP